MIIERKLTKCRCNRELWSYTNGERNSLHLFWCSKRYLLINIVTFN